MSLSPARAAALRALERVRTRAAYAPETLAAVLGASGLSREDAALATRMTYGTLQTLGVLDECIDRHATRPADVEPRVRDALRLAAYELLYMRTPPRAAVHQGVDAVRRARPQATGLANAVLRRLAEEAPSFPWGDPATDIAALARHTGHPVWMTELLIADLGRDAAARMLHADNDPAPLYVRVNPFMASTEEAVAMLESDGAAPGPCDVPGCLVVGDAHAAVTGAAIASGVVVVADAAAQVVAGAAGSAPGGTVIDIAAGRGTKTLQLQASCVEAGAAASVFAVDVHAFKTRVLSDRMRDLHVPGVTALTGDATDPASVPGMPAAGSADVVLLDAPCSGLGTLRRRADRRWKLAQGDLSELAKLQGDLLAASSTLVRPGGIVLYSTCSVARGENHDVVAAFLSGRLGASFRTRDAGGAVPDAWRRFVGPDGCFQSVPEPGGPDGHFAAVLERVG